MKKIVLHPSEEAAKMRLDQYLASHISDCSRSKAQMLIASGNVLVNNTSVTKSNKVVQEGDQIEIVIPDFSTRIVDISSFEDFFTQHLISEKEHFLVINKPAGIATHAPSKRSSSPALSDIVIKHYPEIETVGEVDRPGIVHRLDKETSGIILVAKTNFGYQTLRKLFAERKIEKKYLALIAGKPEKTGTIRVPIIRDPFDPRRMACGESAGREALTSYRVLKQYSDYALIEAFPKTGRTHQIRVHMSHIGHPVLGDPIYGKQWEHYGGLKRYALHAAAIDFVFENQAMHFEIELPEELVRFVNLCDSSPVESEKDRLKKR